MLILYNRDENNKQIILVNIRALLAPSLNNFRGLVRKGIQPSKHHLKFYLRIHVLTSFRYQKKVEEKIQTNGFYCGKARRLDCGED